MPLLVNWVNTEKLVEGKISSLALYEKEENYFLFLSASRILLFFRGADVIRKKVFLGLLKGEN